jgi:hypothetical protein
MAAPIRIKARLLTAEECIAEAERREALAARMYDGEDRIWQVEQAAAFRDLAVLRSQA